MVSYRIKQLIKNVMVFSPSIFIYLQILPLLLTVKRDNRESLTLYYYYWQYKLQITNGFLQLNTKI